MFKPNFNTNELVDFIKNYTKDFSEDNFQKTTNEYFGATGGFETRKSKKSSKLELNKTLNLSHELKYSLLKKKNPRTTISNVDSYISTIKKNSKVAMRRQSQVFSVKTSVFDIIEVKISVMNSILKRDKFSAIES